MNHGGKRTPRPGKKIGAPTGPRTDKKKMGIKISRRNAERLEAHKKKGISRLIDLALDAWFDFLLSEGGMSDLIAEYAKSGFISGPNRHLRPCDDCGTKYHYNDLHTIDIDQNGEHATMEICDGCKEIRDTSEDETDGHACILSRDMDGRCFVCGAKA